MVGGTKTPGWSVPLARTFNCGKITSLREYFDPTRAAKALNTPILGLEA